MPLSCVPLEADEREPDSLNHLFLPLQEVEAVIDPIARYILQCPMGL